MVCIACVGDNCIDYYDNTGEAYPGGNPVNVAVYVRRLGGEASYLGAVGDDANGRTMLSALRRKGVDISHVQVLSGATALTHVLRVDGERVFGDYEEGVMAEFTLRDLDIDFLCSHDLVVSGRWGRVEKDLERIRQRGVPVAFDCAEDPLEGPPLTALPHTDIAFFADDDSTEEELKEIMRKIEDLGPEIVVATRGSRGSVAFCSGEFYSYGIVPCEVGDTMGAGDSYIAGFLMAHLEGKDIVSCMAAGAANAAETIAYCGAW